MTRIISASTVGRAAPVESDTVAGFPNFPDGDVAIAFTAMREYRLHSSVLKRNSKFFAQILHEPGPKLNKQARDDGVAAYRLEFRRNIANEGLPGYWIRKVVELWLLFQRCSTNIVLSRSSVNEDATKTPQTCSPNCLMANLSTLNTAAGSGCSVLSTTSNQNSTTRPLVLCYPAAWASSMSPKVLVPLITSARL